MKRNQVFFAVLLLTITAITAQTPKTYTWDAENLIELRQKALAGDKSITTLINSIKTNANNYVNRTPVSVVDKVDGWQVYFPTNHPVSPNDYISFSTYYWPVVGHETDGTPWAINENSATGGGINYAMRDKFDYPRLQVMQNIVITCSKAYWVTNDLRYAKSAAAQMRKWFVTPATRMLPHMDHAQFGPFTASYSLGSAYGIIDMMEFHNLFNSIELIKNSGEWTDADEIGLKQWMFDFTIWLTTNTLGIKEGTKINNNNHGIYYDILLLEQYLYLGNNYSGVNYVQKAKDYLQTISTDYRITYLTKGTVSGTTTVVDGGMWKELSRSNASGYEAMCMNGYAYLATLAQKVDIDLFNWNYEAAGNQSIREAMEWNIPYIENPALWTWGSSKINAGNLLPGFWISSNYVPSHFQVLNNYIIPQIDPATIDAHEYNLLFPRPLFYSDDFVSIVNPAKNRISCRGGVWATSGGELILTSPYSALTNNTPGNLCLNTVTVSNDFSIISNLKLTSSGSNDGVGLVFMGTYTAGSVENYYYVLLSNNISESGIYKVKGNSTLAGTTRTKLVDITTAISPNTVYNLKVSRIGNLTTVFLNDVKIAEMSDVEYLSGRTGFCTQSGTASILDVRATKTAENMLPFITHIGTQQAQMKVTTGSSYKITADAIDCDGTISKVEYFNGTMKLGESTTSPYSYTYNNIPKGINAIRIVATDNSGGQSSAQLILYTDAPPTSTPSLSVNGNVTVYPNPSNGIIYIKGLQNGYATLSVYDILGKKLLETKTENDKPVYLQNLTTGVYLANVMHDNVLTCQKFLLQN